MYFQSIAYSISVGFLSSSQKQAIIKLLEKRDKDKRFVSLLNVDTKIFSKTVASRFIPILPTIISSDQTAYVKGRFIGESIRHIGILQKRKYRSLHYYCWPRKSVWFNWSYFSYQLSWEARFWQIFYWFGQTFIEW